MKIALIPCVPTEWQQEGRLLGRAELPAEPNGEETCARWAEQLRSLPLKWILHSPDELATRTAKWLGRLLIVPTRRAESLAEVDLGLWSGLTEDQLKARYASAHRELCEAPLNVEPPGGESLEAAQDRLISFLRKRLKRNTDEAFGVVLRPLAYALAWCALSADNPAGLWETAKRATQPKIIDVSAGEVTPAGD